MFKVEFPFRKKMANLAWHIGSAALLLVVLTACSTVPSLSEFPPSTQALDGGFWIAEVGPVADKNPLQYPFICTSDLNGLGQPLIDNNDGIGNAVFPKFLGMSNRFAKPTGHSQYCSIATRVDYFYYSASKESFLPLENPELVPADVEKLSLNGKLVNFVVRVERGTINRFLYSIAMLAPYSESLASPQTLDNSAWNGKLVYKFSGGVGLGHWQGQLRLSKGQALHYESLKRGYAVAFSTGNSTVTHYNLKLAAETALMLKQHFAAIYGPPQHTIGLGGSGGAIQQYVIGEHHPGLIDAAIPQLSFPDMISQTIYVADCELLERYFDQAYQADPNSKWGDWQLRAKVLGLNASSVAAKSSRLANPFAPQPGASVCSHGWRGEVPKTFNPYWAPQAYFMALRRYGYPESVIKELKWSHWNDLADIYPQDEQGFAPNSWDNVGVQYGLQALVNGDIDTEEFIKLNACVGGWKPPQEMSLGSYPWNPKGALDNLDPWDQANMNLSPTCETGKPAVRSVGNTATIAAAFAAGQVFTGKLAIPVVDVRWYMEPLLDIHHSLGSFSARARIVESQGHADNHLIWIAACNEPDPEKLNKQCDYEPTSAALEVVEQWLMAMKQNPTAGVVKNKPAAALDACFDAKGEVIYSGADAWDGILNEKPAGPCKQVFPVYPTSRMLAGEGFKGDLFKCALKSVPTALADGTYADVVFSPAQQDHLKSIFLTGVCDYARPGNG